jgi:hypothetical protein
MAESMRTDVTGPGVTAGNELLTNFGTRKEGRAAEEAARIGMQTAGSCSRARAMTARGHNKAIPKIGRQRNGKKKAGDRRWV